MGYRKGQLVVRRLSTSRPTFRRHHEPDTLGPTQRPRPARLYEGHPRAAADPQGQRHLGIAAASLASACDSQLAQSVKAGLLRAYRRHAVTLGQATGVYAPLRGSQGLAVFYGPRLLARHDVRGGAG